MELIASTIVGVIVAGVTSGFSWSGAGYGVVTFIGVLIIAFIIHLFLSPRDLDRESRKELALVQAQLDELKNYKLKFELDHEAFRSRVNIESVDDNDDAIDDPTMRIYSLGADLRIRFQNTDIHPVLVRDLYLSIVTDLGVEHRLSDVQPLTIQHPSSADKTWFDSLRVDGSASTAYYAFVFLVNLPTEIALSLDRKSFLRITMDATRQELYTRDFDVSWKRANEGYVGIKPRPEKPSNEFETA